MSAATTSSPIGAVRKAVLSAAQQQLWFVDRLQPGNPAYNTPIVLRLRGDLDTPALHRSLNALAARHEVLRTSFPAQDGEPCQSVAAEADVPMELVDAAAEGLQDEPGLTRLVERITGEPFDLAVGPIFRAVVIRVAMGDHILVLCLHHIIYDGSSRSVLFRDLNAFYQAAIQGTTAQLPDLPMQYADYAEHRQHVSLTEGLAYWRQALAGAPVQLPLATDRPRPGVQTYVGDVFRFELPGDVVERVRRLSDEEGTTPFAVLLAGFFVLMARYASAEDLVVGVPATTRQDGELDALIGHFVNMLPLRAAVPGDAGFRSVLSAVNAGLWDAFEFADVPFDEIVRAVGPQRDVSYSPLFQVTFGMLTDAERGVPELGSLTAEALVQRRTTSKFDLGIDILRVQDRYEAELEYNVELFDSATVERLAGHWIRLLAAALDEPDKPV